ncbi:hypothetical protein ACF3M2_14570 [Tissierella carlieri]|jgi:hypothetical protein|uniref:hypothetical protein n=1 Tax=Tissierella carlieri TaxID=689904 RepID=UPI0038637A96
MKNFLEGIKDMLYDSIDYIIMIGIIGIVVLVIGWRLDLLFAKDALDVPPKNDVVIEDNEDKKPDSSIDNEDQDIEEPNDENQDNEPKDNNEGNTTVENPPQDSNDSVEDSNDGKVVKITIPSGSLPSKIGSILESNGLVSKTDFVQKAQELKLDTKLKSGDYDIKIGSSVEDIVKLIADKK